MTDRPILFSAPMILALLAGTKVQTRRLLGIETGPEHRFHHFYDKPAGRFQVALWHTDEAGELVHCASGPIRIQPGDTLWVREGLKVISNDQGARWLSYAADGKDVWPTTAWTKDRNSIPSIHMPRWASRLTLTVSEVRVQRLQDISEEDAIAEGAYVGKASGRVADNQMAMNLGMWFASGRAWYVDLWDRINGEGSFAANPWIVAYSFQVARRNIDAEG